MPSCNTSNQARSPIKDIVPLNAGWSLKQERLKFLFVVAGHLMFCCAILGFMLHELASSLFKSMNYGGFAHLVFLGWAIFVATRFRKWDRILDNMTNAHEGEAYVAHRLNALRKHGFVTVNDIPCEIPGPKNKPRRFNIDHVLIGPPGVFVIETKWRSKRGGAEEKVQYDGSAIRIRGQAEDRDPIAQVSANANTLSDIVFKITGERPKVQPVVIYPGWYVEQTVSRAQAKVWVQNENYFEKAITDTGFKRDELSESRITQIENALIKHQDEMWRKIVGD